MNGGGVNAKAGVRVASHDQPGGRPLGAGSKTGHPVKGPQLVNQQQVVNAPVEHVWEMIKQKIEHPEVYSSGIKSVTIVQRFPDGAVERLMETQTPGGSKTIREVISYSDATRTVTFVLQDDPRFFGTVTNSVYPTSEGDRAVLDYTANWTPHSDPEAPGPNLREMLRAALDHAKVIIEASAKHG